MRVCVIQNEIFSCEPSVSRLGRAPQNLVFGCCPLQILQCFPEKSIQQIVNAMSFGGKLGFEGHRTIFEKLKGNKLEPDF